MNLEQIINTDKKYYMNVYGDRTPVCFKYGNGIKLWDLNDKVYYDFLGGIAVNVLGHCHPKLTNALKLQIDKLLHTSNIYYIKEQALLAKKLAQNSCADKIFFCNSGAEANEGAIKLARSFFNKKGIKNKYEIITLKNSFHGRTLATISATGQEKFQKYFTPLTPGFKYVKINDIDSLKKAITPSTCAVMLELIQGESGVNMLDPLYIKEVKKLCEENNMLLIVDEVQTGIGRTGKFFAYMHYDIKPDIFTLAKALGGGIPIGAVCSKKHVSDAFEPGDHGTTFGGNPFSCTAALTVLDTVINDGLIDNAANMGSYFKSQLKTLKNKHSIIKEVRGKGLMLGIEFNEDISKDVVEKLFNKGFLVGKVGTNIIRLLPPLIVKKEDIDKFIYALEKVINS